MNKNNSIDPIKISHKVTIFFGKSKNLSTFSKKFSEDIIFYFFSKNEKLK